MPKVLFFRSPSEWRQWLEAHHGDTQELIVGFHKRTFGKPSITWPEAVDEALCFGWIDSVRNSVDLTSYTIRFTPRKPRSNWSAVNVKRARELTKAGRMKPTGVEAFQNRVEEKSGRYSYEQKQDPRLDECYEKKLRASKKAWAFFEAQPPGYQRKAGWWVMSAKKEETRLKRLAALIKDSRNGRRLGTK